MDDPAFKTSFCSEYESLLHQCKAALDKYNSRYVQVGGEGRGDKVREIEVDAVLARLTQGYERAYARLVKHYANCETCQFSQRSGRNGQPPAGWHPVSFARSRKMTAARRQPARRRQRPGGPGYLRAWCSGPPGGRCR